MTTTDVDAQLNATDIAILDGLVSGMSRKATAEHAGCSPSTVDRRVADPAFRLHLTEALNDRKDQLLAQSTTAAISASRFLLNVVNGSHEATLTQRIRAAGLLLRANGYTEREGRA